MTRRSCNELGVCQYQCAAALEIQPLPRPCATCTYFAGLAESESNACRFPFAPGAIEHHVPTGRRVPPAWLVAVLLAIASASIALIAGYAQGRGWL